MVFGNLIKKTDDVLVTFGGLVSDNPLMIISKLTFRIDLELKSDLRSTKFGLAA